MLPQAKVACFISPIHMNICMLTSSYPKYPGETTAPFIEEIAAGLVRRGHCVHVVAPYHRDIQRAPIERGVHLHFFRYSPVRALNVFGYAESLQADVGLRGAAIAAAPLAVGAGILELLRLTKDEGRRTKAQPLSSLVVRPSSLEAAPACPRPRPAVRRRSRPRVGPHRPGAIRHSRSD